MDYGGNGFYTSLINDECAYVGEYLRRTSDHDHDHDNHESGPSQVTTQADSSTKKPKRAANFSNDEDELLVSAWLNTSLDAIQSNEQKMKRYWQRVHDYFHKNKNFISDRSSNSLMNRWSTIQQAVNKFCGCYAQIEGRRQSGLTEQDKVNQAKHMYLEIHEASFTFENCWNILRVQPKWLEAGERKKIKKNSKPRLENSSSTSVVNLEQDTAQGDSFVTIERPSAGRKLEKERAKTKKSKEEMKASMIHLMEEIREEKKKSSAVKTQFLEKLLAIEQKKDAIEQKKEEDRIMLIDTTGMPQLQAEYYQRRQREIMDKLEY